MATAAFHWEWKSVIAFWATGVTSLYIKILIHSVTTLFIHHIHSNVAVTRCTSHTPTHIWKYRCTFSSTARYDWSICHLQVNNSINLHCKKSFYVRFKVMRCTEWGFTCLFMTDSFPRLSAVHLLSTDSGLSNNCQALALITPLTGGWLSLHVENLISVSLPQLHFPLGYFTFIGLSLDSLSNTQQHTGLSFLFLFLGCCALFVFHTLCKSIFFIFAHCECLHDSWYMLHNLRLIPSLHKLAHILSGFHMLTHSAA